MWPIVGRHTDDPIILVIWMDNIESLGSAVWADMLGLYIFPLFESVQEVYEKYYLLFCIHVFQNIHYFMIYIFSDTQVKITNN